jgi:large subunit ribosomal protein L13e
MKHNNIIHNNHFHKNWQRYIKTWFDQPAKKVARRAARDEKAKTMAPRPLHRLRPVVRCPTIKYNSRTRSGRGFTVSELKGAKFTKHEAQGLGIAVDYRRRNASEEGFQANVQRLKLYKSKLVVFPRNPTSRRSKKGDTTKENPLRNTAVQIRTTTVLPITKPNLRPKARAITKAEKSAVVTAIARKALTDGKLWGKRERRATLKAEDDKTAALKKGKVEK